MYRSALIAILTLCCANANAWLRMQYPDVILVERSELIVVGHIKKDSITYVAHAVSNGGGRSWEHHATLIITEIIKGKCEEREIPIVIHYGLDPMIGGQFLQARGGSGSYVSLFGKGAKIEKDQIDLFDTGSSAVSFTPFFSSAETDNLWFLRRRAGIYGREPGTGDYGIVDPEDVEKLELKDYFTKYLENEPETAVRAYVATHPLLAQRTKRYFAHLEVQAILKIDAVETRAKRLVPYFVDRQYWYDEDQTKGQSGCEARDGLVACGDTACSLLVKLFDDPAMVRNRQDIIEVWSNARYKGAVPLLIDLLKKQDDFWSRQTLQGDWWNAVNTPENEARRRFYGEVYSAVNALHHIGDTRAKDAIELTLKRWKVIAFSNPQIIEACEQALRDLSE